MSSDEDFCGRWKVERGGERLETYALEGEREGHDRYFDFACLRRVVYGCMPMTSSLTQLIDVSVNRLEPTKLEHLSCMID